MLDPIIQFLKEKDELKAGSALLNVMAKYARHLQEYDTLGRLFHDMKDYESALKYTEMALATAQTNEELFSCRSNLTKLHNHMNQPDKALFYIKQNEAVSPGDNEVLLEKVFSLFLLNRKDEAEVILRKLDADPNLDEKVKLRVQFNLGTYDLYHGNFQEGLKKFILIGKEIDITKKKELPIPQWEGGVIPGMKLLIVAEAGIGDEVINFRFCQRIKDLGMEPIWLTANRPDLAVVFRRSGFEVFNTLQEVSAKYPDPKGMKWCYSMALPIYLDVQIDELWQAPYLFGDNETIFKWRSCFNQSIRLRKRIGIRWSGNQFYDHDLHRSIPIYKLLECLVKTEDSIYSFQKENSILDRRISNNLGNKLVTWDDTIAALLQMDLLITSCTSIAHIAGAIGIPTIVMVPISAYYTWASTHDHTSAWYGDHVRVIRQVEHDNWDQPFKELAEML